MKKHKTLKGLTIIAVIVLSLLYAMPSLTQSWIGKLEQYPASFIIIYSAPMLVGLLLSLVLMRITNIEIPSPKPSFSKFNPLLMVGGVILMYAAQIVIAPVLSLMPESYSILSMGDNVALMQSGFYFVVTAIFISPLISEWLFRGVFQTNLARKIGPMWALLISAILFALSYYDLKEIILNLGSGLVLATIFYFTNSLSTAIGVHMLFNITVYLTFLVFGSVDILHTTLAQSTDGTVISWTVSLLMLIITGWRVWYKHDLNTSKQE